MHQIFGSGSRAYASVVHLRYSPTRGEERAGARPRFPESRVVTRKQEMEQSHVGRTFFSS